MKTERIHSSQKQHRIYTSRRLPAAREAHFLTKPIDAIAFDVVEYSGNEPEPALVDTRSRLTDIVRKMPDKEVARRIKKYRDSFSTIDDALAEKVFMESI